MIAPPNSTSDIIEDSIARFSENSFPFLPSDYKGRRRPKPRSFASTLSSVSLYVVNDSEVLQLGGTHAAHLIRPVRLPMRGS